MTLGFVEGGEAPAAVGLLEGLKLVEERGVLGGVSRFGVLEEAHRI